MSTIAIIAFTLSFNAFSARIAITAPGTQIQTDKYGDKTNLNCTYRLLDSMRSVSAGYQIEKSTDACGVSGVRPPAVTAPAIEHDGKKYDVIRSPYTGRLWLDRNIGASRVCRYIGDKLCYGDLYQWGRGSDGHEMKNSVVSGTRYADWNPIIDTDPLHFVTSGYLYDWTSGDNSGAFRIASWGRTSAPESTVAGSTRGTNTICPIGFYVPTADELRAEINAGKDNLKLKTTVYKSMFTFFLKLPWSPFRGRRGVYAPSVSLLWTSSIAPNDFRSPSLAAKFSGSHHIDLYSTIKSTGANVRCIAAE